MARLSRKNIENLPVLPVGYVTASELISGLLDNPAVYTAWTQQYPTIPVDIAGVVRVMFMKNSWQLTTFGATCFSQTFASWELEHDDNALMTGRILISMSHIAKSPWYNRGRHVYVWSESVNFEMWMFDGSLKSYIDFYLVK
jgi:hypothetical protein